MALSSAQITQSEKDLRAADKPIIAANALTQADRIEWRDAAGSTFNLGVDLTDSAFPPSRIIDSKSNVVTQPNTSLPAGGGHLLIDTSSNPIEFDFVAIVNHNLGTIGGGGDIRMSIANDEDFSSDLRLDIAVFGPAGVPIPSNDGRLLDIQLDVLFNIGTDATRYSGVEFIRFEVAGFSPGTPFFGEIIFGRRRQLQFKPRIPWGPDDKASSVDDAETKSGVINRHINHKGKREFAANLNPSTDPFRSELITFYDTDTDFGTRPFVWIEDPQASPLSFHWLFMDPEFSFPFVGPFERSLIIAAREQGPHHLALGK